MKPLHWMMMLGAGAIGGISYLFIKWATEGFSPSLVAWSRPALGALTLGLLLMLRSTGGGLKPAGADIRKRPRQAVVFGIFQFALPMTLLAVGELVIPSHLAGILVATIALWTAILAPLLDRTERISRAQGVGLLIGFVGVGLVVGIETISSVEEFLGALAILGAAVSWAVSGFISKRYYSNVPALQLTFIAALAGAVILFPIAIATFSADSPDARAVISILVLGTVSTAGLYWIVFRLIQLVGVSRTSASAYLLPVFGLFYGAVLGSETVKATAIVGTALILAGVVLASRKKQAPVIETVSTQGPVVEGQAPR